MDPMTHIELVDRDNNVIAVEAIPASAFPITMRLVNAGESTAGVTAPPETTGWRRWVFTPVGTLAVIIGTTLYFELLMYLHQAGDPGMLIFGTAMFIFFGLLIWPTFWTFFGRHNRRKGQLRAHQLWTCAMIVLGITVGYLSSWLTFLWPDVIPTMIFSGLTFIVYCVLVLYGHLTIASRLPAPRRWYLAGMIVAIFGVFGVFAEFFERSSFDANLKYDATIKSLDARFVPAQKVDAFAKELGEMEKALKKESQKK